jgi:hypothetical protein
MSVYSIWESRFPADRADEGVQVVVEWESREAADGAMSYASHPNAQRVDRLVGEPRRRTVGASI